MGRERQRARIQRDFRTYVIEGKVSRQGEVLQELRWAKQEDGWKIVSERDLRVIRQARR